jgi:hypothetical protein
MSLRKEITRYKNKIHAILLRNGIQHHDYSDLFGPGGMTFLRSITLSDSEQYSLTSYLNILETLIHEKTQTAENIETLCKNNPQAMLLTSIPGISYYSAMSILTEIGRDTSIPPSEEALQLCRVRATNHPIRRSCLPGTNPERMQSEPQMDPGPMHPHPYPPLPEQLDNQTVLSCGEQEGKK